MYFRQTIEHETSRLNKVERQHNRLKRERIQRIAIYLVYKMITTLSKDDLNQYNSYICQYFSFSNFISHIYTSLE